MLHLYSFPAKLVNNRANRQKAVHCVAIGGMQMRGYIRAAFSSPSPGRTRWHAMAWDPLSVRLCTVF